jgi:two-component system chemotaxis sensor kinase CheA
VPRLAERFGKQVELAIEGGDLRVDVDVLRPVIRELGHLVRNAIDHGIEPTDQRAGKPAAGRLTIRVAEHGPGYQLQVIDDGGGIDVERLIAKACAAGLCSERDLAGRGRQDLLDLVFLDGLSSAETTSEVSGRGVGMSAIRSVVEAAGGTIHVHSVLGQGTRVEITLPARRAVARSSAA